jgi:hypothetical protein
MKHFLKTLLSISIMSFCFPGCNPNPTKPEPPVSLQDKYQKLTNSLMAELEQFRGKPFKRGISVALNTQEQFRARIATAISELSAEEKKKANAVWVRENLLHPGMDFFAGYDSIMASMTGGFYAFGSDTITVVTEGTNNIISLADSVSIFHELVHAMQDQYFDLMSLQKNDTVSDQGNAYTFVFEGEAELFSVYYQFKLVTGLYPSSPSQVVTVLNMMGAQTEQMLDSLHLANQPLLIYQPLLWAYFPYGPLFINAVSQGNWSVIDNKIFASLPVKTREVVYPSNYITGRTEYLLDMSPFLSSLDSTQIVDDKDELGYVLTHVMFREWDNYSPDRASVGLTADNIIVYHGAQDSTLRMVWYTKWNGASSTSDFMSAYRLLVNKKRNIILDAGSINGNKYIVNDTINRIFIEQTDSTVIILEDYLPQYLNGWLDRLHATQSYLRATLLAKRVAHEPGTYPRIDKNPLTKGFFRRAGMPVFHH